MTNKEAINVLRRYTREYSGDGFSKTVSDAHEKAIEAIKAMESRESVKPANIRRSDGGITEGFCACGTRVNNYMKFCDQCGKKLDWSGE